VRNWLTWQPGLRIEKREVSDTRGLIRLQMCSALDAALNIILHRDLKRAIFFETPITNESS